MTSVAEMLDRIEEKARTLKPKRAVQGAVTLPLYVVGYTIGLVIRGIWWAGAWAWSALVVGFKEGAKR